MAIIRTVPETFGTAQHAAVYAAIADLVYVPTLQPDFAYIHTREEYELVPLTARMISPFKEPPASLG